MSRDIVPAVPAPLAVTGPVVVPVSSPTPASTPTRRFLEFFAATIRNRTRGRPTYRGRLLRLVRAPRHLGQLADIEPMHVAAYIEALQATTSRSRPSSSTSPRSACCSTGSSSGQVLATNPAHAVRGPNTLSSAARPRC